MKSGERYIIEIEEVVGNLAKIKGFNALVFDEVGLDKLDKIENGTQMLTPYDIGNIKKVHHDIGYSEGFADGEKYQANKMASKTEPHKPRMGDIYRRKDSTVKIIITYDPLFEGEKHTALFPDGGYQVYDAEKLNKYFEFVENRADALEPIKGALA